MRPGARSPEELESLFEDAFVTRDPEALAPLFDESAVLVAGRGVPEARGVAAIAGAVAAMWGRRLTYVADPRRVVLARDTGLIVAPGAMSVVRRGADRSWRYSISLIDNEPTTERNGR